MKKKILIVDDDESLLEGLKCIFEEEGYEVTVNADGKIEDNLVDTNPDLILLDYRLPNEDGGKIAKRIKTNLATAKIPIIMISADGNLKRIVQDAGADGFVEKPFEIDYLIDTVKNNISN